MIDRGCDIESCIGLGNCWNQDCDVGTVIDGWIVLGIELGALNRDVD